MVQCKFCQQELSDRVYPIHLEFCAKRLKAEEVVKTEKQIEDEPIAEEVKEPEVLEPSDKAEEVVKKSSSKKPK